MSLERLAEQRPENCYYKIGEHEERFWGRYVVLNTGSVGAEAFCEKKLFIKPRRALSLQRHQHREEIWKVLEGTLTVIINNQVLTLKPGDRAHVPQGAYHCIINVGDVTAIMHEWQIGLCREDDNERVADYAGRNTKSIKAEDLIAHQSVKIYRAITYSL